MLDAAEEASDLAALHRHEARELALGKRAARADFLPAPLAWRLMDGESPVRIWREHRGLTQRALAEQAGQSVPYLCEIEAGRKPGSAHALAALAAVLGVTAEDLLLRPAE